MTPAIETLPSHLPQGILALYRTLYRIVHRCGPLSHLEGDAELVPLNAGTIVPSYRSPPSRREHRFISHPFRI